MLRSFLSFFRGQNSDLPPEYQTVDPLNSQDGQAAPPTERGDAPLFEPHYVSPTEQDDTPRNRFDYYVDLRRFQQLVEWQMRHISPELYGELDSQVEVARDWVIDCWKRHGIWAASWLGTGPSHNDKWPCRDSGGVPTSLLSLELEWEMEHLVELHRPTRIPELFGSQYLPPTRDVPLQWGFDHLVRTALYNVSKRWRRAGFRCSGVDQPGVRFCRDLKLLYASLPIPARETLDSLDACCWADLFRGGTRQNQAPRTDMFGRLIGDAQANSMPSPTADGSALDAPRTTIFGRVIRNAQGIAIPDPTADGLELEPPRFTIFGQNIRDVQANAMPDPTVDGSVLEPPRTGIFGRINGDAQVNAIPGPTADGLELEEIGQMVQTRRTAPRGGRVPRRPPRRRGVVKRRRGVAESRRRES
ncbi:Ubiquitin [Beauveria brongniartii RCEF 3172]|uniref:Ubiquitin n=1 Tax=Beauveria brongniartii RCEF 3172 TaxID=1081107 RepID=A0A166XYR9_9HYPO|nr:Ubiquitin [Beauveria brongniartii RCEF 3172]